MVSRCLEISARLQRNYLKVRAFTLGSHSCPWAARPLGIEFTHRGAEEASILHSRFKTKVTDRGTIWYLLNLKLSGYTDIRAFQQPETPRHRPGIRDCQRWVTGPLATRLPAGTCVFTCSSMKKSQAAWSQSNCAPVSLINKPMCTLTVLKIQFKLFVCCCLL